MSFSAQTCSAASMRAAARKLHPIPVMGGLDPDMPGHRLPAPICERCNPNQQPSDGDARIKRGPTTWFDRWRAVRQQPGPLVQVLLDDLTVSSRQQLGAVFEVHRVEMRPAAAPDETVPLEDGDDFRGDTIDVGRQASGGTVP